MKAAFASALAFCATPLLAQDTAPVDPAVDTNADGFYSFPELQAAMPDATEDMFTSIDTSGDGLIDAAELAAAVAAGLMPAAE
jgi:hypothetical protein